MFTIDSKGHVFLDLANHGTPASVSFVIDALAASQYADFAIHTDAINAFFKQDPQPNTLLVATKTDATLEIKIADDKMTATGYLKTAQGGKMMSLDAGKALLVKSGVSRGYKQALLESLLAKQFELSPGDTVHATIAQGRPATNGTDAQLEKQVTTLSERLRQPKELEDGRVDHRDFGKLASVTKGTVLIKVTPETQGTEGFNVIGDSLPPSPGQAITLSAGEGTLIPDDNPHALIAACDGVPIDTANGMRVDDIFTVDEVCVKTGHIDFDGSILITKGVDPSMKVTAKGDINILGTVDGAEITALGNISVKGGIIGHLDHDAHQLTTKVTCGGDLTLGHAQYACLSANNISVERLVSHCELTAKNSIKIAEGKKGKGIGKFIGGKILDAKHVIAAEIGSESGAKVEITMMQAAHQLIAKHETLLEQLSAADTHLFELTAKQVAVDRLGNSKQKKALQAKVDTASKHWMMQSEKIEGLLAKFDDALHFLLEHSDIKISQTLHPGVEFKLFNKTLKTSRTYPACRVTLQDNNIHIEISSSNQV
ncbi:DUF342 domain-containing protein [Pseudoalteromonas ulvae]|uniref:Flagellar Assembly Protein A N-terminal region domain-containing protein n=1 Tax=Pseudoalteromonas ulvae TaxID=107327 RepID=A0A244CPS3_PSEDV|nr:FapA family protein [Pseudoalteromonas ulvae]OUL57219.1 hypothetical protein B1199_13685 [Pseudoalteromonas ulvae]